jgi:tetratricopeptide (TPR) repeat protein
VHEKTEILVIFFLQASTLMAESNLNKNLDADIFIWLDDTIETSIQNRDTKALIRQMVKGRLLTFTDPDQCVDYIFTKITTQKTFFIVSNKFGSNVVPLIYEIPQIQTIYVYCGNRQAAESWTKSYPKVSNIFTKKETLLRQICEDVRACSKDDDLPMSVFHLEERQNSLQNLSEESAKFMWYQSILRVVRLMSKYYNSKTEMIVECRANYHNDEIEKKKIHDFELNYAPAKAFWWYTSDSFVYRLLNKALRTQNIEIIFKFRFFINDLHNQIQILYQQYLSTHSSHKKNHLIVYRGQRMTVCELNLLKNNVNQLISMNSFLSATTIREIAEIFADTSDQCNEPSPLQSVVFTIDIRDFNKDTTAFAFIQNYSCCPDEKEVLFTIGAIFKVESVIEDKEKKIWHVHLQLNKKQNEVCQDVFHSMINQIGSEPGPISFGWFLYRMSEFNKAERYLEFMITQLPSNDKEIGNAYNLLGLIYKDLKLLSKSIECYEKALEIYSLSNYQNSSQIVATHYNLGLAYLELGDDRNADEHRKQADFNLINSSQINNPLLIAMTDSLKAKIQIAHGDYSNAFKSLEEALAIKKKELSSEHPSIASTLNEMGIVQEKMGNDEKAFEYFTQALEICQKYLLSNHFDLAQYHANIGRIHYKREQYKLALKHFELALKIITDSAREENDNISTLLTCIAETKQKLK